MHAKQADDFLPPGHKPVSPGVEPPLTARSPCLGTCSGVFPAALWQGQAWGKTRPGTGQTTAKGNPTRRRPDPAQGHNPA